MKIYFIYRDKYDRRARYGKILESYGHTVIWRLVNHKKSRVGANDIYRDIRHHKPSIVWLSQPAFLAYGSLSSEAVDIIRASGARIVCYSTFPTDIHYSDWLDIWRNIDYNFVHNREFCAYLIANGVNAYYMPIGFYPDQYYKTVSKKILDISFMGNCQTNNHAHDRRCIYLRLLQEAGIKVKVYGSTFNGKGILDVAAYSTHAEQRAVYAKSTINIDFPFVNSSLDQYQNTYHLKNRTFEIPATGNFMITADTSEVREIYDDDDVGFYSNQESFIEIVNRYLVDTKLAATKAANAYAKVISKHTYMHRFAAMAQILGIDSRSTAIYLRGH